MLNVILQLLRLRDIQTYILLNLANNKQINLCGCKMHCLVLRLNQTCEYKLIIISHSNFRPSRCLATYFQNDDAAASINLSGRMCKSFAKKKSVSSNQIRLLWLTNTIGCLWSAKLAVTKINAKL